MTIESLICVAEREAKLNSRAVVRIGYPRFGRYLFVDVNHPDADDSNPGTESQPWLTINAAESVVVPGDTVWVKAGNYLTSHLWSDLTGPIAIRAFPGHKVDIGFQAYSSLGFSLINCSYITIDGLTCDMTAQPFRFEGCNHIVLENCEASNTKQEAVRFLTSYDCIVRNCYIHHVGLLTDSGNGEGVYIGSPTPPTTDIDTTYNILVLNNLIHDTLDEGVECKEGTHDCVIDGNHIYNSSSKGGIVLRGRQGFVASDPLFIIRNNICHDCTHDGDPAGNVGNGIQINSGGATVYNNVCYDNEHYGIQTDDVNLTDYMTYLYHNTCYNNGIRDFEFSSRADYEAKNNIGFTDTDYPDNLVASAAYFVDAAGGDFRLIQGSAPIDAGVAGAGIPLDILGRKRVSVDMGAYEFVYAS